ncbi:MAG: sugar phosphate isomerase/epimerase [Cryobacterium sp.]|nr:sugar phosphate isomerase/epimerase [Cryobacterium sp.]
MKLGVYTAVLHDRPLIDALDVIASLGLSSVEINTGGFLRAPHIPIDSLLSSASAREDYLDLFRERHLELTALNVNGNPLHPNPDVGPVAAEELKRTITLAPLLGVRKIVTMSGLPSSEKGGREPNWIVNPWHSNYSDIRDYQWSEVVEPFWLEIDRLATDSNVEVCLEMHPHNVVFNPATLIRLVERTASKSIRAELDPSHLFWQGIDPAAAVDFLGELVGNAAAKDTRINDSVRIHGVLDDRFRKVPPAQSPLALDGPYTLNDRPRDSSWDFVAVGRGHDISFWTRFLEALEKVDPNMAVNIEHEDAELGQIEGLAVAAKNLLAAESRLKEPHRQAS